MGWTGAAPEVHVDTDPSPPQDAACAGAGAMLPEDTPPANESLRDLDNDPPGLQDHTGPGPESEQLYSELNHEIPPDTEQDALPEADEECSDIDWEDEERGDRLGFGVPRNDEQGNKYVTIVDSSGIHHLPVIVCQCTQDPDTVLEDCVALGLFASSFKELSTLFTKACLEQVRLLNLAAKTTPYQYHHYLRRITNRAFPAAVPNRYRELLQMSRQYRIMLREKLAAVYMPHCPGTDQTQQDANNSDTQLSANDLTPRTSVASTDAPVPPPTSTPLIGNNNPRSGADDSFDHRAETPIDRPEIHVGMRRPGAPDSPFKLSLFCPSCPQPGVNVPVDFIKEDGVCICCGKQGR